MENTKIDGIPEPMSGWNIPGQKQRQTCDIKQENKRVSGFHRRSPLPKSQVTLRVNV
jgi:hypothetical protein